MKISFFRNVDRYQQFRGICCHYLQDKQIKQNEIKMQCSTHGRHQNVRQPEEKRSFEDLQTDVRILKQIKIQNGRIRI
jgi:hypothetical protein